MSRLDDGQDNSTLSSSPHPFLLSPISQGIALVKAKAPTLLPLLFRKLADESAEVSGAVGVTLVNLSSDPVMLESLLGANVCDRLMEHIRSISCPHHDYLTMILANVTTTEDGVRKLVQHEDERLWGFNLAVLLKLFVDSVDRTPDLYEHVAHVLCNVTSVATARRLVLEKGRGLLDALRPQLTARSTVRRRGAAGTFKNCCMGAVADKTLGNLVENESLLRSFLLPIGGGTDRDSDDVVRETLIEALHALAVTPEGRNALVRQKAQDIMREGYADEENHQVNRVMEAIMDELLKHPDVAKQIAANVENNMVSYEEEADGYGVD